MQLIRGVREPTILAFSTASSEAAYPKTLEELERFAIVSDHADRRLKFVRLGSLVTYRDLVLQRERTVRVGLPGEADVDENRISVLAPVGAALMGLSVGDVFRWAGPDDRLREIEVMKIED